jgi:hypothetical protein
VAMKIVEELGELIKLRETLEDEIKRVAMDLIPEAKDVESVSKNYLGELVVEFWNGMEYDWKIYC